SPIVHKSNVVLIFINQIRQNINALAFGPKETTTGGNALKFYASVRLDVRRIASLKKNDDHFGNRVAIKVVKNKVAAPFKKTEVDLLFNQGISKHLDVLDIALANNIVEQSGSWFAFDGEKIGQGREQVLKMLESDMQLFGKVLKKVKDFLLQAE
ncbi:DNA recombination/repair protein RecA, partial [bacterium]|nr:DNA recombination/repair protein RecA [bacterium]